MIGMFDSGLGGLTVLKDVAQALPEYSYMYLGDNARAPYGSRGQEAIYRYTKEGVRTLFDSGCELVILACNTASSAALRRLQQEWLPDAYPDRRILGVIVPTAEEVPALTQTGNIGILATEATVASEVYVHEIAKRDKGIAVFQQACPLLVPIIEAGEMEWEGLDMAIQKYLTALFAQSRNIDTVVLGCTHYALIEDAIREKLLGKVRLVSQGSIVAEKLREYLLRHPEMDARLEKQGRRLFYTTERSGRVEPLARLFYGEPIMVEYKKLEGQ